MPKSRTKFPTDSFSAQLLRVLEVGCVRPVEIKFPTEKAAIRFGHRINGLRLAMRHENRTDWEKYYQAGVYPHPSDPCIRIIRPRDSEFKDAITAAGIPDPGAAQPGPDTNPAPTVPSGDPAEDFLADLRRPKLEDL